MDNYEYQLLKECSDKKDLTDWNLYRLKNQDKKIKFRFCSFKNFYLKKANLNNVNFVFCSLENTQLDDASVKNVYVATQKVFYSVYVLLLLVSYFIINIFPFNFDFNIYNTVFFLSSLLMISFIAIIGDASRKKRDTIIFFSLIFFIFWVMFFGLYTIVTFITTKDVAMGIVNTVLFFLVFTLILQHVKQQNISIGKSKNPLEAKGFNIKYISTQKESKKLKEELAKLESESKEQEKIQQELESDNNLSEAIKESFQKRLVILEKQEAERLKVKNYLKDRIETIEKEEIEEEQISRSMDEIKESFSHIKETEKSLFRMNVIYSVFLLIGLVMLVYFGFSSFDDRENVFTNLGSITFGSSLGIVLFYATPIVFSLLIITYSISNINKNIKDKEKLLEKKYLIELIESTFYAQIKIGGDAKEALQKLINKLGESAYEKLSNSHNNIDVVEDKQRESYLERMNNKRVDMLFQSLLKKL